MMAGVAGPPRVFPSAADLPAITDRDEAALADALFTEGVEGQTVMILGTGCSLVALHALERGAREVAVVNPNRRCIRASADLAQAAGLSPLLIHGSWKDALRDVQQFDQVVCSFPGGRIAEPVAAIARLMQAARRRLIIEVEAPKWSTGWGIVPAVMNWMPPMVWLPRPAKPGRVLPHPFLFSAPALRNFCRYHTTAFEPPAIHATRAGRLVLTARRRRVRNLVVLAGPSSSGKSVLRKRLANDPEVSCRFGLAGAWQTVRGRDVAHLPAGEIENLIVELDLMAVERGDPGSFGDIPQYHIFRTAENVKVLTVVPLPKAGRSVLSAKESSRLEMKCGPLGKSLASIYAGNGDDGLVHELYDAWFAWLAQQGVKDVVLVANDYESFRLCPVEEFEKIFAQAAEKR